MTEVIGCGFQGRLLNRPIGGIVIVQNNESLLFQFDRGGREISDYICTILVKQYPDNVATITRQIDPEGLAWPGFITASEMSGLDVGLWYLTGILSDQSADMLEEVPLRFQVAKSWAN